jgi:hypothetical protein
MTPKDELLFYSFVTRKGIVWVIPQNYRNRCISRTRTTGDDKP